MTNKKRPQDQTNAEWLAEYDAAEAARGEPLVAVTDGGLVRVDEVLKKTVAVINDMYESDEVLH